ncbi:MAG TPA: hypothetical protein VN622_08930 [Clostridia bacterium]|nr:hypothetical protein [Clostridia bacterium]
MKRLIAVSLVANVLLFIMLACGGGNSQPSGDPSGPPTSPNKAMLSTSVLPGGHIHAARTTVAFNWSLIQPAFAQTSTISLSQSWNGACNLSPTGVSATISGLVYRLGQDGSQNCTNQWFNDTDGSSAAANAQTGQLVVGNGTMSNLVVWTSPGTQIVSGTSVHLWVLRSGSAIDTHISCTLPAGTGYTKCSSAVQFQAMDGDYAVATFTLPQTDKFVGLNVVFTKQ